MFLFVCVRVLCVCVCVCFLHVRMIWCAFFFPVVTVLSFSGVSVSFNTYINKHVYMYYIHPVVWSYVPSDTQFYFAILVLFFSSGYWNITRLPETWPLKEVDGGSVGRPSNRSNDTQLVTGEASVRDRCSHPVHQKTLKPSNKTNRVCPRWLEPFQFLIQFQWGTLWKRNTSENLVRHHAFSPAEGAWGLFLWGHKLSKSLGTDSKSQSTEKN